MHFANHITGRLTAEGGDFLALSRVLKRLFDHGLLVRLWSLIA
jgi:hypothetical protein